MASHYSPISFIPSLLIAELLLYSFPWATISFMAAQNLNNWILASTSYNKVKVNTNKIVLLTASKIRESNLVSARCFTYVSYCVAEYNVIVFRVLS